MVVILLLLVNKRPRRTAGDDIVTLRGCRCGRRERVVYAGCCSPDLQKVLNRCVGGGTLFHGRLADLRRRTL